jgi:hypothetical protein
MNSLRILRRWKWVGWESANTISILFLLVNQQMKKRFIAGEVRIICPDIKLELTGVIFQLGATIINPFKFNELKSSIQK